MTDLIKHAKEALEEYDTWSDPWANRWLKENAPDLARLAVAAGELARAGRVLSIAAQTTGGTAGPDRELQDAIAEHAKADATFRAIAEGKE